MPGPVAKPSKFRPLKRNKDGSIKREKKKKGAAKGAAKKPFDVKLDEFLGMTRGKEAGKKMSPLGRRKVSRATRGKR